MTRKRAKELSILLDGYSKGKTIQVKELYDDGSFKWVDIKKITHQFEYFKDFCQLRFKPDTNK